MFGQRGKSVTTETVEAVGRAVKGAYGNAVVISKGDVVLGVRLETGANRQEGQYGPEDNLAVTLGDVLRHLTGTPPLEIGDDEGDAVRYVPTDDPDIDDPAYVPPGRDARYYENARLSGQWDLLAVIRDQVRTWGDSHSPGADVVSVLGLKKYLAELDRRMVNDGSISPAPF